MNFKWRDMTNKDRNQLISREVLKFDCFETDEGKDWYERHYDMGFWHYTTNLKSALELAEKVSMIYPGEGVEVIMKICNGRNFCKITSHGESPKKFDDYIEGETLEETICLATLKFRGILVDY